MSGARYTYGEAVKLAKREIHLSESRLVVQMRDAPVVKQSSSVSARYTYGEAVMFPGEPMDEPSKARSQ